MGARGVQGNMAAQVRVMGHDAAVITYNAVIPGTETRGVALYVGVGPTDIECTLESGNQVTFKAVAAGTFMPILVTQVRSATGTVSGDGNLLAIY